MAGQLPPPDRFKDFEQRRFKRSEYGASPPNDATDVEGICERCGKTSTFPAVQRGSVQTCPHCRASVGVGPVEHDDEWWMAGTEDDAAAGE